MSIFKKILVPLDGSECSLRALEKAIEIAKKFDGKITLFNVYNVSSFKVSPSQVFNYVIEIRKSGESILEEAEKIVKAEGIQVEKVVQEGHIVEVIVNKAREENFDLIVLGAQGISKIKEMLLGSVSHGVTSHSPCPVLVVK